jgi:hypothetical protein
MAKTATLHQQPGDEERPAVSVVRIADPKRTHQQVHTLLSIMAQCEHTLIKDAEMGTSLEVNAKAEQAAAETYALASLQLRNIIDDMDRWVLNASDGDKYLERLAEAQHSIIQDQKENLDLMRKPHRRLGAKLIFVGAAWVCFLGEQLTEQCLHGIGRSPAEACEAFDDAFLKRIPEPDSGKPAPQKPVRRKKKA